MEFFVAEFLLTFIFLLLTLAMMAIGVICGRVPISGSCGGLKQTGQGSSCEMCGGDSLKCKAPQYSATGDRLTLPADKAVDNTKPVVAVS